jgi:hypothetical protein
MDRKDLQVRTVCKVCTSGDTSGIIVPGDKIGHIKSIDIDTAAISGNAAFVKIQIYDKYTPTDGSATTKLRKQISVNCGDVIHLDEKGDIQIFTRGDIRCDISGPVVTQSYVLE